jgi:ParB-like chromosome segregation protein Spo0J
VPNPATTRLFDTVDLVRRSVQGVVERIPLDELALAPNPRKEIDPDGIERLAHMLATTGQLIPCIGARPDPAGPVLLYDGQRRLLAAQASHPLAGTEHHEHLAAVQSLIVLLLDHEPTAEEIRRIQAQANQREDLSLTDQQQQFRDCWQARAGLQDDDRVAAVCADLGISAKKAHNLRRQLTLPEPIRGRVAERPAGAQLSVTMANRLADMHDVAPQLTEAVAQRITTTDLHDKAMRDLGAFVHRTVVEDEHTYAVRIDDGDLLDGAEHVEHARAHLTAAGQRQAAGILGRKLEALDSELDTLAARAKAKALKVRITPELRERARTGRYAYVHDRGQDFAAGIWVVDPVFMLDAICEQLKHTDDAPGPRAALLRRRQARRRRAAPGRRGRPPAQATASRPPRRRGPRQPRTRP